MLKFMSEKEHEKSSRRDFLTGVAGQKEIRRIGDKIADRVTEIEEVRSIPRAGEMIRLSVNAMACEFALSMNPGSNDQVTVASDALARLEPLEQKMTIYRETSDLSRINRDAFSHKQIVDEELFQVIELASQISQQTAGAFEPTMGPLVALWRKCRKEERIPDDEEIQEALKKVGMNQILMDPDSREIQFRKETVKLDLGGIGKGYAIDRIIPSLLEKGLTDFLFHGGHSSISARGFHLKLEGWPIGIRNPHLIEERLATLILKDQAMSTSGSNAQYYRYQGKRYGHILDPRTGYPAEALLAAIVVAPTAAVADALSTAFFVMGLQDSIEYCRNHTETGAILIPKPKSGRKISPVIIGVPENQIYFHQPERDLTEIQYI